MAKPSTKGLLKSISSDDLEQVYISISNKAIEWAVAGFLEEANHLLSELWKYNIPHSGHLWLPDEGLQVMWTIAGKQPTNIPFSFKNIREIEEENWSRAFYPCGDNYHRQLLLSKSFEELSNSEVFFKAINAGYDHLEKSADILAALPRALKARDAVGSNYAHITFCGALLAARNNFVTEAEYFIKKWGEGYSKYWTGYILAYLMRDRATAQFLLKGLLAPVFKLTPAICERETQEILEALEKRMAEGRTLVYGNLSWSELLNRISRMAIEQKTMEFSQEFLQSESLSRPPASKEEVKRLEHRLNLTLPEDYRKFLLTSNGFESFSSTGVTLASAEKVDYLTNVNEQLMDIWAESMDDINPEFCEKLKSSIIIGGHEEEQQLLLVPLKDNSWECWHFSSWMPGEVVYQGFRFYMEDEVQKLEDNFFAN
jgi:hypothetical protein